MNSGLIVINKEKGYTSRDVVNIVGKVLNTKKIGHTGTLDPLATGVLVVGFNSATKIFELLFNDDKEYIAEVIMGYETDTLDTDGEVVLEDYNYSVDEITLKNALNKFVGTYLQEVPMYSAVKLNGKKLYEYARNNENVNLPKRNVNIKEIELLEFNNNTFKFRCVVSKGTYIRSLIRDIGRKLNVYCTMSNLTRTRQGTFHLDDAATLDDIRNGKYEIISLKNALSNYEQVVIDEKLLFKVTNGQKIYNEYSSDIIVFIYDDRVVAIYKKDNDCYRAYKVFNV